MAWCGNGFTAPHWNSEGIKSYNCRRLLHRALAVICLPECAMRRMAQEIQRRLPPRFFAPACSLALRPVPIGVAGERGRTGKAPRTTPRNPLGLWLTAALTRGSLPAVGRGNYPNPNTNGINFCPAPPTPKNKVHCLRTKQSRTLLFVGRFLAPERGMPPSSSNPIRASRFPIH